MPLVLKSSYRRPNWLFNGHLETIYPSIFRKVSLPLFSEEKLPTPDGDFLELDWYRRGQSKLVIISHGLEGNSKRPYIVGMARSLFECDYDILAWNYRGCGAELNQKAIFYHSGATYDLDTVVNRAQSEYDRIYLVGFSLGGNLTLKFLGEKGNSNPKIKKAVAISVPLDLGGSCDQISSGQNRLYAMRFLKTLLEKVERKAEKFPEILPQKSLKSIQTLRDFDDLITGPLHGFKNAEEYYRVNSSLQFLDRIEVPTLILNAQNDPFLSPSCFPTAIAKKLDTIHLEVPRHGGHVGFTTGMSEKTYYSEARAVEFINNDL